MNNKVIYREFSVYQRNRKPNVSVILVNLRRYRMNGYYDAPQSSRAWPPNHNFGPHAQSGTWCSAPAIGFAPPMAAPTPQLILASNIVALIPQAINLFQTLVPALTSATPIPMRP